MKKLAFKYSLVVFFFLVMCLSADAQIKINKANDTIVCLRILGMAVENKTPLDGVQVTLYKENDELEWEEVTSVEEREHHFLFNLLGNSYYTIDIVKPGYVKRSVGISTMLPQNVKVGSVKFTFDFEVDMLKEKENVDDYYMDFPVALIGYDKTKKSFQYNAKYTKHIKAKVKDAMEKSDSTKVDSVKSDSTKIIIPAK